MLILLSFLCQQTLLNNVFLLILLSKLILLLTAHFNCRIYINRSYAYRLFWFLLLLKKVGPNNIFSFEFHVIIVCFKLIPWMAFYLTFSSHFWLLRLNLVFNVQLLFRFSRDLTTLVSNLLQSRLLSYFFRFLVYSLTGLYFFLDKSTWNLISIKLLPLKSLYLRTLIQVASEEVFLLSMNQSSKMVLVLKYVQRTFIIIILTLRSNKSVEVHHFVIDRKDDYRETVQIAANLEL